MPVNIMLELAPASLPAHDQWNFEFALATHISLLVARYGKQQGLDVDVDIQIISDMPTKTVHFIQHITKALEQGNAEPLEQLLDEIHLEAQAQGNTDFSIALNSSSEKALAAAVLWTSDSTKLGSDCERSPVPYTIERTDEHSIITFTIPNLIELVGRLITCEGVPTDPDQEDAIHREMKELAGGICLMFDVRLSL
jgi:hypothetical protein